MATGQSANTAAGGGRDGAEGGPGQGAPWVSRKAPVGTLQSCHLPSILEEGLGLTRIYHPTLGRCFGSLTLCHPLLQIRLNSRGLIYSVGLLLASVFVTVGLQLSPLSSPHLSPHPLGFFGYRVCLDTRWAWPPGG